MRKVGLIVCILVFAPLIASVQVCSIVDSGGLEVSDICAAAKVAIEKCQFFDCDGKVDQELTDLVCDVFPALLKSVCDDEQRHFLLGILENCARLRILQSWCFFDEFLQNRSKPELMASSLDEQLCAYLIPQKNSDGKVDWTVKAGRFISFSYWVFDRQKDEDFSIRMKTYFPEIIDKYGYFRALIK